MSFFIKLIKNIFFYSISFPVYLLIIILTRFFNLKLHYCDSERIGHFLFDFLVYMELKKKPFVIWVVNKKVCNNFLLKKANSFFFIVTGFFSKVLFFADLINKKTFNFNYIYIQKFNSNYPKKIQSINKLIKFNQWEINDCRNRLKKIGIKNKFICLHVRDSFYLKKNQNQKWKSNSFRDCKIINYKKLINFFINKGYYVVRMGYKHQNKISIKNSKFIHYNLSEFKNDMMDFYLAKECEFIIGTSSGWENIPLAYKKKALLTNVPNFARADWTSNRYYLFKKFSRKKHILNLREALELKLAYASSDLAIKEYKNIKVIENTPTELLLAAHEFYKIMIQGKNVITHHKNLNASFLQKMIASSREFRDKKISGYVSFNFLKKNY